MNPDNLRNWLSSVASDLRTRKLLPVLVLLIAAAVAIPLLLSHSGKAASLPAPPPAPTVTASTPSASTGTSHRHEPKQNFLTGPSHNPFVAKTTTTASTTTGTSTAATGGAASTSTSGSASSGTTGGGSRTHTSPTVAKTVTVSTPATTKTTTVPATLAYTGYEAEVSLLQTGAADSPTVFHNLSRDQLIPSDDVSFAAFLGVRSDKRTAVFVLPDGTTVTGSGNCAPSATSCRFLTLSPGQSVAVVLQPSAGTASTYTLKYVKVTEASSSASTVTTDQAGAADVNQAAAYVSVLKSIQYAKYSGLLTIRLGSTAPVNRLR